MSLEQREPDPWLDALEKAWTERENLFSARDPEDIRTIILRRLVVRYNLSARYVSKYMPLMTNQFVYDYARGQSVRKCFELVDLNFIDLLPRVERVKVLKVKTGRGLDPFTFQGDDEQKKG